jgi:hypothetical protein
MIGVSIDPDDLEGRRRLSLALTMSAANPDTQAGFFRTLARVAHELWVVVLAPVHGRIVGLSLLVLALLVTADIWVAHVAAITPPAQHSLSERATPQTVRMSTDRPAVNGSITAAASPF